MRQALSDAELVLERVSPKAAHDYAEVFDGVPSKHDGKDAAVVADLSALGKSAAWPFEPSNAVDKEMAFWVDGMDAQRRILGTWYGRLEGLLARHWPEATRQLSLTSATLLKCLSHYGSPTGLAADDAAPKRLRGWGGRHLKEATARKLISQAEGVWVFVRGPSRSNGCVVTPTKRWGHATKSRTANGN